LHKRGTSYSW